MTLTQSPCAAASFLLEKMAESGGRYKLSPRLYALSEQIGIGYIFPVPESELETPAKARREKQHRVSGFLFFTNALATTVLSHGERDNTKLADLIGRA